MQPLAWQKQGERFEKSEHFSESDYKLGRTKSIMQVQGEVSTLKSQLELLNRKLKNYLFSVQLRFSVL